jgi:tetratricopeptide (TPR) repeat protein
MIYSIGALILFGALYLSKSSDPAKPGEEGTEGAKKTTAEAPIQAPNLEAPPKEQKVAAIQDPTLTAVEQETSKIDETNSAIKESEQYFRKGQREYLNKNYHRAIEAFRSALALQKNHPLADYYLRLAVYEVETEAKKNWEIAGKYFQSMQYQRAIYHYTEVINLMQHRPSDKMVENAEKYILQCKRRLQAAELFP